MTCALALKAIESSALLTRLIPEKVSSKGVILKRRRKLPMRGEASTPKGSACSPPRAIWYTVPAVAVKLTFRVMPLVWLTTLGTRTKVFREAPVYKSHVWRKADAIGSQVNGNGSNANIGWSCPRPPQGLMKGRIAVQIGVDGSHWFLRWRRQKSRRFRKMYWK